MVFCANCGSKSDGGTFCLVCGSQFSGLGMNVSSSQSWSSLLVTVGINSTKAAEYEELLETNGIDPSLISELNQSVLQDVGITMIGDRLKILKLQKIILNGSSAPQQTVSPQPEPPKQVTQPKTFEKKEEKPTGPSRTVPENFPPPILDSDYGTPVNQVSKNASANQLPPVSSPSITSNPPKNDMRNASNGLGGNNNKGNNDISRPANTGMRGGNNDMGYSNKPANTGMGSGNNDMGYSKPANTGMGSGNNDMGYSNKPANTGMGSGNNDMGYSKPANTGMGSGNNDMGYSNKPANTGMGSGNNDMGYNKPANNGMGNNASTTAKLPPGVPKNAVPIQYMKQNENKQQQPSQPQQPQQPAQTKQTSPPPNNVSRGGPSVKSTSPRPTNALPPQNKDQPGKTSTLPVKKPSYEEPLDDGSFVCIKCNQEINEAAVSIKGSNFHLDCFTCGSCEKVLQPNGQYLKLNDSFYHKECLRCSVCFRNLATSEFYVSKGTFLCEECNLLQIQKAEEANNFTSENVDPNSNNPWSVLEAVDSDLHLAGSFTINKNEYTIGRAAASDILINTDVVSGTHCKIIREIRPSGSMLVYLLDNSVNGTFLNGALLGKGIKVQLYHKDVISMPFTMATSLTAAAKQSFVFKMLNNKQKWKRSVAASLYENGNEIK